MNKGDILRAARGRESRRSVCAAVGITQSALSMYEAGKRVPRDDIKIALAKHYRTTVQELFFPEDAT